MNTWWDRRLPLVVIGSESRLTVMHLVVRRQHFMVRNGACEAEVGRFILRWGMLRLIDTVDHWKADCGQLLMPALTLQRESHVVITATTVHALGYRTAAGANGPDGLLPMERWAMLELMDAARHGMFVEDPGDD